MKIVKSKRVKDTFHLEIESSYEDILAATDKAFKKVVKNAKVQGFRKGKVPRDVFEKNYGTDVLIREATMDVVNDAYTSAIKELDLAVVDYPKNLDIGEVKENEPLRFSCDVDIKPEVKLGKYKGLKAEKDSVDVNPEEIEKQISQFQEHFADYKTVEDGIVEKDDIVSFAMKASIDGEPFPDFTQEKAGIRVGYGSYGDAFDEQVKGLSAGAEKSFDVQYDESFDVKAVAGKTVHYDLSVLEIKKKVLPELTDEFVETNVREFKTVDEFRKAIEDDLSKNRVSQSDEKLRSDLIDKVLEDSKMELHDVMVEREIDRRLKEFEQTLQRSKSNIKQYLKLTNKTMDALRDDFREQSAKSVKIELVLEAIAEKEKFTFSEEDLKAEIKSWNVEKLATDEDVEAYLKSVDHENLKSMLKTRKAVDFLVDHAKISTKKS